MKWSSVRDMGAYHCVWIPPNYQWAGNWLKELLCFLFNYRLPIIERKSATATTEINDLHKGSVSNRKNVYRNWLPKMEHLCTRWAYCSCVFNSIRTSMPWGILPLASHQSLGHFCSFSLVIHWTFLRLRLNATNTNIELDHIHGDACNGSRSMLNSTIKYTHTWWACARHRSICVCVLLMKCVEGCDALSLIAMVAHTPVHSLPCAVYTEHWQPFLTTEITTVKIRAYLRVLAIYWHIFSSNNE